VDEVGRLLDVRVGNKADRSVKTLGVLENVEGERDLVAAELRLDTLNRVLHADPKVDLLRRRAGGHVARELGDTLDLLDPRVDVALQLVEERRLGEKRGGLDVVDRNAVRVRVGLESETSFS
jgi:hypothetical protein